MITNNKLNEINEEILNNLKIGSSSKPSNSDNSNQQKIWKENEINDIELLNYLHDWNFPIFQLYEKSDQFILSHVLIIINFFIKNNCFMFFCFNFSSIFFNLILIIYKIRWHIKYLNKSVYSKVFQYLQTYL